MSSKTIDASTLHDITEKEKELTGDVRPVKRGPTAQAQRHVEEPMSAQAVSDITRGEKKVTGSDAPVADGPAAMAQSMLDSQSSGGQSSNDVSSGKLDSSTISKITAAEKQITGEDHAVKGGPTAQAQKHVGEPINSETLHDITEGEKVITDGERIKGGPTSTAQSELGKSRS
ncbi:hypothetical protein F5Y18DRAFT_401215 [Xylariaceae sp. FL1019]|nr:hypothetical protein F5Y18DRAFT_401215 [Xylariaceae sp. FL1019]